MENDSELATISRLPRSRPFDASKRAAPTITIAPTQATVRPTIFVTVAASLRSATATPTVNTGMVAPMTMAFVAVVRASPAMKSSMFAVMPNSAQQRQLRQMARRHALLAAA